MTKLSSWKTISFLCVLCTATAIMSPAQTNCSVATPCFTSLFSFNGTDGEYPFDFGSLVQGRDGNFYGTTLIGGIHGAGTIFKITPGGALTPLHSFDGTDGSDPESGLVLGFDGYFYGTASNGGSSNCSPGCGTVFVFKLNTSGNGGHADHAAQL